MECPDSTTKLKASKTFPTSFEAHVWANSRKAPEGSADRFSTLVDDWENAKVNDETSSYRLGVLRRYFKTYLTVNEIEAYRRFRLKSVTNPTVRLDLQMLSRILKWRRIYHGYEQNPCKHFEFLPANPPKDRVVTAVELAMLKSSLGELLADAVDLAYQTAMRRSEITRIRPDHIDWENRKLLVPVAKNGHARYVPLNKAAIEVLQRRSRFPIQPHPISTGIRRAAQQVGLVGITFHTLRHTAITRYANRGLSTAQLQVVSGHRDIKMLAPYTHLKAEDVVGLLD